MNENLVQKLPSIRNSYVPMVHRGQSPMRWIGNSGRGFNTSEHRRPVRNSTQRLIVEALEARTLLATFLIKHAPYIQLGDAPLVGLPGSQSDQVEIMWQTVPVSATGTDSFQVQYRRASTQTWTNAGPIQTIDTGVEGRVNQFVTLVGLDYDADYTYVVRHLRNSSPIKEYQKTFHTRLPAGSAKPFSFVAYGDSALGPNPTGFITVQSRINTTNAAFSLLLGDNAYESGSHAELDARFDPSINPVAATYIANNVDYYAVGNHEILTAGGQPSRDDFAVPVPVMSVTSPVPGPVGETPEHNYSFDYGNVHFATVDSNGWFSSTRLQNELDWLVADMQASKATWKVAFAHHALSTVGGSVKQAVETALQNAGVNLFLAGHDHSYHRNYNTFDGSSLSGTTAEKGAGVFEITAGEGGKDAQGFLKVDASSDSLNMTYFDANTGSVKDSFSISGATINHPPTDLVLSPSSVLENSPNGTVIGQLSTSDPDAADPHTYSLLFSSNGRFAISGNQLIVANGSLLDAEASCNQAVYVQTTDVAGESLRKTLSIAITGVNEFAPTSIGLSAASVREGAANGTVVGELSTTDPDACQTQSYTYSLLDDAGGRFAIAGNRLTVANGSLLNRQESTTQNLRVQTADSGGLTLVGDFTIYVEPVVVPDPGGNNQAPQVNAGLDQTVSVSGSAKLAGMVKDDGLPKQPGQVATTWTQVSGPGTAAFQKASATNTSVTFSTPGTYVLRLEANDGALVASDDITITVASGPANQAPQVNAGADQTVLVSKSAKLVGKVKDDGLPKTPGKLTTAWSKLSGPGTVIFAKASAAQTNATFSAAGTYVLRLEASDGALSASDDVAITVTPGPVNQAPQVDAGADQTVSLSQSVKLKGKVKDDGLPKPPGKLSTTWTQVSGPGTVTFQKASSASTTALFDAPGTYVLRLTADDGSLQTSDDVTITVNPAQPSIAALFGVRRVPGSDAADSLLDSRNLVDVLFDL